MFAIFDVIFFEDLPQKPPQVQAIDLRKFFSSIGQMVAVVSDRASLRMTSPALL